jgi:hypothetical protein
MATLISSFLPTLLVSVLTILVPLILLLVAKKAHTIVTLSELHDRIMTRYYKFLILNLLVFFCIGSVFLVGFFTKFHDATNPTKVITAIQTAFPTAGPFYVGWRKYIWCPGSGGGAHRPLQLSSPRPYTGASRSYCVRPLPSCLSPAADGFAVGVSTCPRSPHV